MKIKQRAKFCVWVSVTQNTNSDLGWRVETQLFQLKPEFGARVGMGFTRALGAFGLDFHRVWVRDRAAEGQEGH